MPVLSRRALLPRLAASGLLAAGLGLPAGGAPVAARDPEDSAGRPLERFPTFFGSREIPSDDLLSRLPRASVLIRSLEPTLHLAAAGGNAADVGAMPALWSDLPAVVAGAPPLVQLRAVNRLVNRVDYVSDWKNYGSRDRWATPEEFFARGGDCEDFAIAKFVALHRLGFHETRIRVALVFDKVRWLHHSVLIACPGDTLYVLDNQIRTVVPDTAISRYNPICSFDTRHLWFHRL